MTTTTIDPSSYGVTVQSIQTPTTTGGSFTVGSTYASTGVILASPGQLLVVQVGVENYIGDPDTCTIVVTDPHSNQSFQGVATITWDSDDTSTQWVQFSNFPLQADQVTPMDKCNYSIAVSNNNNTGTQVYAQVHAQ